MIETHHPYAPLTEGTGITYAIYNITCAWHDSSFGLDVLSRQYSHTQKTSQSCTIFPNFFGWLPLFTGYQHAVDADPLQINYASALVDGVAYADGEYYIGEAGNPIGLVHIPFIAKIAFNPYPGQTIDEVSKIYKVTDKSFVIDFHWKYKTVGHYDNWGAFADVWRTGLREYNPTQPGSGLDQVYNYAFMRGVGLVDLWYGQMQADGTIKGIEYYAVEY